MGQVGIYFIVVLLLALFLYLSVHFTRKKNSFSIPEGKPVYNDLKAQGKIMVSQKYGLSGKPDKVVQDGDRVIPYEYKSTNADKPRDGHMLQMAAYFLILEENFPDSFIEYGVLKYRNYAFRIENSQKLRDQLFTVMDNMRDSRGLPERNHVSPRRCVYCSFRNNCSQKLIK